MIVLAGSGTMLLLYECQMYLINLVTSLIGVSRLAFRHAL